MTNGNRIQTFITASARGFITGLNQATASLNKATKTWKAQLAGFNASIGPLLGAAGVGVAARALDQLAESAVRAGDSIGKAARTAGIGAESLQQYREAADLTGTSQQQLDDALGRFTRRLGEARRGNRAYAEAFRELGVEITDTNEQALDKTFRVLADIEDITIRTSLATKVFGDDARRMALIVDGGAEALDRMKAEASAAGRVLDEELVAAAENAQDRLTKMERALSVELNTALLENIDGFVAWREAVNDVQAAAIKTAAAIGQLVSSFKGLVDGQEDDFDLLVRRESLLGRIDAQQRRIAKSQERLNSRWPGVRQQAARNIEDATRRLAEAEQELADVERRLAAPREREDRASGADRQTTGGADISRDQAAPISRSTPLLENKEIQKAAEQAKEAVEDVKDETADWRLESELAGKSIADAFSRAIVYGDSLGQTLKRLSAQLASRALSNFLLNAVGGGLGGGGSLFGGFLASGGPVAPGRSYVVGEQGPELFTPSTAGRIIPNGASIDGGVVVNQTLRFDVGLETVDARVAQVAPMISAATYDAIEKGRSRPRFA